MDISKVISISGMPGLYKVIAQSKGGVIVESLIDKKRFPAFGSSKISTLEDISIYTTGDDMPLKDVLTKMFEKENGAKCPDAKSLDEKGLHAYVAGVLPEYDKDRVHTSDLKKLLTWYNLLHDSGLLQAEESKEDDGIDLGTDKEKSKVAVKKEIKQNVKTSHGHVKTAGVRKSGTA